MKVLTPVVYIILLVWFFSCTACQKKASDEVDPGTYDGSVYQNEFFKMRINLPSDWSYQGKKEMETLKNAGKKMMENSNKKFKAAEDISEYHTVHLFAIFKHPLGTPVKYNPNLMCIAERIGHVPSIKRGKDYQYYSKKVLESSQMNTKFPRAIYSESLGDTLFDVLYSEMTFMNTVIKQKQYTIIKNGYALTFNISFTTEDQESQLKKILDTIDFD